MSSELLIDKAGRIELPEDLREKRRFVPGARVSLDELPDGSLVLRVKRNIRELVGIVDPGGIHLTIEEIEEAIAAKGIEP